MSEDPKPVSVWEAAGIAAGAGALLYAQQEKLQRNLIAENAHNAELQRESNAEIAESQQKALEKLLNNYTQQLEDVQNAIENSLADVRKTIDNSYEKLAIAIRDQTEADHPELREIRLKKEEKERLARKRMFRKAYAEGLKIKKQERITRQASADIKSVIYGDGPLKNADMHIRDACYEALEPSIRQFTEEYVAQEMKRKGTGWQFIRARWEKVVQRTKREIVEKRLMNEKQARISQQASVDIKSVIYGDGPLKTGTQIRDACYEALEPSICQFTEEYVAQEMKRKGTGWQFIRARWEKVVQLTGNDLGQFASAWHEYARQYPKFVKRSKKWCKLHPSHKAEIVRFVISQLPYDDRRSPAFNWAEAVGKFDREYISVDGTTRRREGIKPTEDVPLNWHQTIGCLVAVVLFVWGIVELCTTGWVGLSFLFWAFVIFYFSNRKAIKARAKKR